jgi:hypothetical protein
LNEKKPVCAPAAFASGVQAKSWFDAGEVLRPFDFAERGGITFYFDAELAGDVLIDDVVGEGGFSGSGNAGDAGEETERDVSVQLAQVMAGGAADLEELFGGLAAFGGDGDGFLAGQPR